MLSIKMSNISLTEYMQCIAASTQYEQFSRCWQELNAAEITGLAFKSYYTLLFKEEDNEEGETQLAYMGAGLGFGFVNTKGLHAMNYTALMNTPDKSFQTARLNKSW